MMYSQQEYDMVRRQTMQIESEKRALLRMALIGVTVLLAGALLLSGIMYQSYSTAESRVRAAETKAADLNGKLLKSTRELTELRAQMQKESDNLAAYNKTIETIVPKMLGKTASTNDLSELAHAIFQQPGHVISLPSIPPDNVLRKYRIRVDGRPYSYVLVAGLIDGKWMLYSNLIKNQED